VTAPWSFAGAPDWNGGGEVTATEGTTFCISDDRGDVGATRTSGLYVRDTRVLRTCRLTLTGRRLEPLRVHRATPYGVSFTLFSPAGGDDGGLTDLVVNRERFVGDGMHEEITVHNAGGRRARIRVVLEVDADFLDLFEVKEGRERAADPVPASVAARAGSGSLDLSVVRHGAEYAVTLESGAGTTVDRRELRWDAEVPPHGRWSASLQVVPRLRGERLLPHHRPGTPVEHAEPARRHRRFRDDVPRLTTSDRTLADVLERSIDDLGTLRIFDPQRPDLPVIAAGAPWFMALFGRDSLITSMMLLPVDAGLALGTLTTLSSYQGTTSDPVSEEQPGRIPHEVRFGPAGTLALGGRHAYYGSADATPLFVMAVGELLRWQPALVGPALVAAADRALDWLATDGDPDHDGFVEYARSSDDGLVNQGWKDSWDGITFADGSVAEPPIALAEVQAYTYAALLARAEIADSLDDERRAGECRDRAAALRTAFDASFWLPQQGWYAVGLDRDKRPIDALTSNIGHCLWTGIAEPDRADRVAAHLLSPRMFTGWGIRTLASDMGAYNPMSYHNGSVWPHDTAICVAGLARYGHAAGAADVALGLLDSSEAFGGRLPELFAGFARDEVDLPVPYPAACSPQAWAAAAPLDLLRSLLGLEPGPAGLECRRPAPDRLLPLQLHRVSCRGSLYDVEVDHRGSRVTRADVG
jgi:glycogen debranching enzyme